SAVLIGMATLFGAALEVATLVALDRQTRRRILAEAERERLLRAAEAEAANLAKDEFLAVVSHELRPPLHAMTGWLSILKKGLAAGRNVDRAIEIIERNIHAQARLVNDLLDVSRIVSKKLVIEEEPVDLCAVVKETVDGARPAAEAKGVALECCIGGGVHP